jgi:hypothetical protein
MPAALPAIHDQRLAFQTNLSLKNYSGG